MQVRILFFASVKEATGLTHDVITIQQPNLASLKRELELRHESIVNILPSCMFAVDNEYVHDLNQEIVDLDKKEIALIPPISGG